MPRYITSTSWIPSDNMELEAAALLAVKSTKNSYVIAGPGAGKTELLAQRASYLLETNTSPLPKKILAISFKKDAAKNLQDRVLKRCGKALATRFESLTFDAFGKRLFENFRKAIPESYRPSKEYELLAQFGRDALEQVFIQLSPPKQLGKYGLAGVNKGQFLMQYTASQLPHVNPETDSILNWAIRNTWTYMLNSNGKKSQCTFPMISRIVEYMLRKNPLITRALRSTYSHVFLDEFQDTTDIQYDLLKTAFKDSSVVITAVGDDKQRIMGWAGAMHNAFETYKTDFDADEFVLLRNFRSAPNLVKMQQVLATSLTDNSVVAVPSERWNEDEGTCEIWNFNDEHRESVYVANQIRNWIASEGINPRDICILSKVKPERYCGSIISELSKFSIKARIEANLQDILSEPCVGVIVDFLRLACYKQAPMSWGNIVKLLFHINGINEEARYSQVYNLENELKRFISGLSDQMLDMDKLSLAQVQALLWSTVEFLNEDILRRIFPVYQVGDYLQKVVYAMADYLYQYLVHDGSWTSAIEDFIGINTIPIMTIHKSKGLEYDTVLFVGLEDSAFFKFQEQTDEDTAAFFVAFSRAKRRVVFTYSQNRQRSQSRSNIKSLYDLLSDAGVKEITI
ncbi:UvrD-helicase domain-containing protein [Alicyclobacillus ferrooxydans]|uniref:DNA 3'-5' helicase n=1 Tax=Alicyclobacillus ferrooxydans TaxID=471514 RepID=A0A0P9F1D2_9BACL|nr:ATP-dependent helicase [Alicyclobacillus ferrooxydans]KPV45183.1 hypothetical protein AN477_03295 [Alicyclobacillus ferrooxydans]